MKIAHSRSHQEIQNLTPNVANILESTPKRPSRPRQLLGRGVVALIAAGSSLLAGVAAPASAAENSAKPTLAEMAANTAPAYETSKEVSDYINQQDRAERLKRTVVVVGEELLARVSKGEAVYSEYLPSQSDQKVGTLNLMLPNIQDLDGTTSDVSYRLGVRVSDGNYTVLDNPSVNPDVWGLGWTRGDARVGKGEGMSASISYSPTFGQLEQPHVLTTTYGARTVDAHPRDMVTAGLVDFNASQVAYSETTDFNLGVSVGYDPRSVDATVINLAGGPISPDFGSRGLDDLGMNDPSEWLDN